MTPEGKVKALVKAGVKKRYPKAYQFMPVQNGMGAPGLDIYYCINGLFVAVETKAPGKKMTERQQSTACAIVQAGGLVFCVDGTESLEHMFATLQHIFVNRACIVGMPVGATLQG